MPINKSDYPDNWKDISLGVREAAGFRCELCNKKVGELLKESQWYTVLTVHHIDGDKDNNYNKKGGYSKNLISLCQRCHFRLDSERHLINSRKTRQRKKALKLVTHDGNQ